MKSNAVKILLTILLFHKTTTTISVVYNFRIAQITRQPVVEHNDKTPHTLTALLFNFFQKTRSLNIRENYSGGLVTFNYNIGHSYYLRSDFAVSHVNQTINKLHTVEATEPDDILLTAGRNFKTSNISRVTLSGLLGIPTHSVNTLQRVGFGAGQVGLGIQIDGLYKLNKKSDLLWGSRYNRFIPRTAQDILENQYKFTIGNIADVLVGLQTSIAPAHGLETGYAARWGFGIKACPLVDDIERFNYRRNNFYLVYKYTLLTPRVAHRLIINIAYGYDAKPKRFGYDAVMLWGSWSINF